MHGWATIYSVATLTVHHVMVYAMFHTTTPPALCVHGLGSHGAGWPCVCTGGPKAKDAVIETTTPLALCVPRLGSHGAG